MDDHSIYPMGVPFSINYPEIPLYAFLENSARKFPSRDAIIFFGKKITYNKLWNHARILAASFKRLGVSKDDRVGLLLPNVPQFIIAYNAILLVGGVVVPINPLNDINEINRELMETDVKILIALDRFSNKIPEDYRYSLIVTDALTYAPRRIRFFNRIKNKHAGLPSSLSNYENLLKGQPIKKLEDIEPREDLAVIQHTSGTSGKPKGVMLTHYNLVANALQSYHWLRGWGFSAKPQRAGWPLVLCAVPFFHSYGMTVAMNESIQFGCTLVLVPEPTANSIMKAINRNRVTHFPVIPRFIKEILAHPNLQKYDLTSLTSCVSGGMFIEPHLIEKFIEVSGTYFYHGYGLTEASPTTHCTPIGSVSNYKSVGLPFPDTKAKIVDLQLGEIEMTPGEKGELIVSGPQVMKGYWKNPEETSKALKKGWLYTGDIAWMDKDGYLYIVGRKKERIITGGHTVWPTEVEKVVNSHPKVKLAVAFGVLDPLRCSNNLNVLVVLNPNVAKTGIEDEIIEYCRDRLEYFQVPDTILFTDQIPRTPLGDVDREAIETEYENSRSIDL